MKRSSLSGRHCSIARASAELVDSWSFVILREVFLSNRRFDGLQAQTSMSPRSLTLRLTALLKTGILERKAYSQLPPRYEYRLTDKGLDFWPVMIALKQWGDKWTGPWGSAGPPLQLTHNGHEHTLEPGMVCVTCGESVDARSATIHMSKPMLREREAMVERHRRTLRKVMP